MTRLPTVPSGGSGVSFAFESFGRRIGLSLCDSTLVAAVSEVLPPGWTQIDESEAQRRFRLEWLTAADSGVYREGFHLYDGDEFTRWAEDERMAVEGIETEIEHDIAEFADPWLFMHAGVVAWQGQAIVLPGASHAGKSTLTAALVEAGAIYYSDEFAVLDANGQVVPFPRRLSLRDGPFGPTGRLDLRHRAPCEDEPPVPLPIGLVAMLRYEATGGLDATVLQPGEAIRELCQHMVAIQRRPADVLTTLNRITQQAPVLDGTRGDARSAARWLLRHDAVMSGIMNERAMTNTCR